MCLRSMYDSTLGASQKIRNAITGRAGSVKRAAVPKSSPITPQLM